VDEIPVPGTAVFDLDGTLARIEVDWQALRERVALEFPQARGAQGLAAAVATVSSAGGDARSRLAQLIREFEQPGGRVRCHPCHPVVDWAARLRFFYVVTNNLHSTARQVVERLGLSGGCSGIVGFDDVRASKPDPESWHELVRRHGPFAEPVLYIGDRDSDEQFARNAGIGFRRVEAQCA
jgi:phosphoglycolate phosphatase-like HAD superfamily hydrolase